MNLNFLMVLFFSSLPLKNYKDLRLFLDSIKWIRSLIIQPIGKSTHSQMVF